MSTDRLAESIQLLANRIRSLRPTTGTQVANVGLMAGALYALNRAAELHYDDSRASPNAQIMAAEFAATLGATATSQVPPNAWLAGFYFHSATMRLAALNTRLDKVADVARQTRRSVNSLKHDANAHISGLHVVKLARVLTEATKLCELLEASVPD